MTRSKGRALWLILSAFIVLAVLLLPSHAFADNAPMWESPAGLAPGGDTRVRMASEQVEVKVLERNGATIASVTAWFDMVNDSAPVTMTVGFPTSSGQYTFIPAGLTNFRVAVGTTEYRATEQTVANRNLPFPDKWYVWRMPFERGTTRIQVSYEQRLGGDSGSGQRFSRVGYVLKTGALWAGSIGEGTITFIAPDGGGFLDAAPAPTEVGEGRITWRFRDLEPTEDLSAVHINASDWKAIKSSENRLSSPSAPAAEFLSGAKAIRSLTGDRLQLPQALASHYYPLAFSWAKRAAETDPGLKEAWELLGDLDIGRAYQKHGWLECWPAEGVDAYRKAQTAGSASAGEKLRKLEEDRTHQLNQGGPFLTDGAFLACEQMAFPISAGIQPPPTARFSFKLGFQALAYEIWGVVGVPIEEEHYGPNGDSLQRTSAGLMVWRKADNWTAFTNGGLTWINGPEGVRARANDERFDWEGGR